MLRSDHRWKRFLNCADLGARLMFLFWELIASHATRVRSASTLTWNSFSSVLRRDALEMSKVQSIIMII